MRTPARLILLFTFLLGSAIVGALAAAPQVFDPMAPGPNIAAQDAALEAEIAKLRSITRVSELSPDSVYTFTQVSFDPVTNTTSSLTLHRTVHELLMPLTPSASAVSKRDDPDIGPVCETSGGSPMAIDVIKALVDMNRAQRQRCCQVVPFSASRCFTMQNHGTAPVRKGFPVTHLPKHSKIAIKMRNTCTPFILLFAILFRSALVHAIAAPQPEDNPASDAKMAPQLGDVVVWRLRGVDEVCAV
ncbi:hypothetical protein DFP73DRAFT_632376 [Morchella snyderi]|nr:hypothetical protein DFP73DRAFT_632376 [Morchella snyderi]